MRTKTIDRADEPVSLAQILAARDRRAARQQAALGRFALPVVSLGAVMPGPVKDSVLSRTILDAATRSLDSLFFQRAWPVHSFEPVDGPTGPEALYVVEAGALVIKQAVAGLEDSLPLGRLWDIDVICPQRGLLSRRMLGHRPRRCLLCEDEAHACARSQRHSLADLLTVIEETVDTYLHRRFAQM
jgi:holo-ACP synthase